MMGRGPALEMLPLREMSRYAHAMRKRILRECGIRNETETKRKAKMLVKRDEHSKSQGCGGLTVLQQCIQRLTQRTVKFIRWLKNHLDSRRSWQHSLARLAKIYARS